MSQQIYCLAMSEMSHRFPSHFPRCCSALSSIRILPLIRRKVMAAAVEPEHMGYAWDGHGKILATSNLAGKTRPPWQIRSSSNHQGELAVY